MLLAAGSYLLLLTVRDSASFNGFIGDIICFCLIALLFFMIPWRWRTWSFSPDTFYGGRLRNCGGFLWKGLRASAWFGFVLVLIHTFLALRFPMPDRQASLQVELLLVAFTFYFGCLVLFGSLYGVSALFIYRFFWELFHGHSRSQLKKSGVEK